MEISLVMPSESSARARRDAPGEDCPRVLGVPIPAAERHEIVRTYIAFFGIGGALALITLALPHPPDRINVGVYVPGLIALGFAGFLWVASERLPAWSLPILPGLGTVLSSVAIYSGGAHVMGAYSMFYFFVVLASFYHFPLRLALPQLVGVGIAFALVLWAHPGSEFAELRWVMALGTLTVAGLLLSVQQARVKELFAQLQSAIRASTRSSEQLARSERRTRQILETAHDAFVSIDERGIISDWNSQAKITFGWSREEVHGRDFTETIVPASDRSAYRHTLEAFLSTGEVPLPGRRLELTGLHRDGHEFPLEVTVSPLKTEEGYCFHAFLRDVTERRRAERAVQEAEERFRGAFEEAPIGMALARLDGRFQQVNRALCEMLGYSRVELEARSLVSLSDDGDSADDSAQMRSLLTGQTRCYKAERRYRHARGHSVWGALQATVLRDSSGEAAYFLVQFLDVTDRRRYEENLEHMAHHDALTGLLNRRSFERTLEAHLKQADRYGHEGAVLLLDLDNFKYINDSLGHRAGDELINAVAQALSARLRETDLLARLGGDEFAVLLPKESAAEAESVANALLEAVREQEVWTPDGRVRTITASVGIATIEDTPTLAGEDIMVNADLAMYDAKEAGRDRLAFAGDDDSAQLRMKGRMTWVERIRTALEEERFTLLAQPIVELATGRVAQHELLLRMRDETTGELIPPGAFLYLAERLDLIQEIDRWVVGSAIALLEEHAGPVVEVNLSGRSLGDPRLLELVESELTRSGVVPARLIFEVTETAAVRNIPAAKRFGERLTELGCRFALDDFGAGFGSFNYLKNLPLDFLKIDGEFIANCRDSHTDQLLIQAVVDIAHGLGKKTVAEFVGDEETVRLLARLGVDYGQGFYLGHPEGLARALTLGESGPLTRRRQGTGTVA
jgi:diguanylate cyclase (GGDEF)-like protein/PAS domain S-box-containing protein